jgi:predicted choloylglycine hydrolase
MKSIFALILIWVVLLLSGAYNTYSCTMVMVSNGDKILAGNNEDWKNPKTKMWVIPSTKDEYGRIGFGFDDGFTQGGMNDRGLFIDANALAPTGWKSDPAKPDCKEENLIDYLLARCATVDEVIDFFNKNNCKDLESAKFPIADAIGDAAVIEWGQGKLQCIKRTGRYQISTNFVQSNFAPEAYPCTRYAIAETILGATEAVSIDLVRAVLSATHSEGQYPTVYSNIYDLKNKRIYLYNFHNFEEVAYFNLDRELKRGKRTFNIPSLFKVKTQAARLFDLYKK